MNSYYDDLVNSIKDLPVGQVPYYSPSWEKEKNNANTDDASDSDLGDHGCSVGTNDGDHVKDVTKG